MAYETLKYEREDGIAVVTLNRPERMNALGMQSVRELRKIVDEIQVDEKIRVLIVTGAPDAKGRPCFCAGADMK